MTKIRRVFPMLKPKDHPDENLLLADLPIGAEDVAIVMMNNQPFIAATSAPNGLRAMHELFMVPANTPFEEPIGRDIDHIGTVAVSTGPGQQGVISFYALLPWPTSSLSS